MGENAKWTTLQLRVERRFTSIRFNWNMNTWASALYVFIFTVNKGTHVEGSKDENSNIKIIKIFLVFHRTKFFMAAITSAVRQQKKREKGVKQWVHGKRGK